MKKTKTLVIHTGGIGDFILACQTVSALSEDGPVTLAGNSDRLSLAVAAGIAHVAHDLSVLDFQSVFADPSQRFRSFVQSYHRAIIWMNDPDDVIAAAFQDAGINDVHVFPGLPPKTWTRHASDYYRECLSIPDSGPIKLHIEPAGPSLDVIIQPGSGSLQKNTPLEDVLSWAEILSKAGRRVTWCLGPAERERLHQNEIDKMIEAAGENPEPLLECQSLVELARRFSTARLYLGNDSGITHLAVALGVPAVACFRTTNPAVWAPLGDKVTIITEQDIPLDVQTLQEMSLL